MIEHLLYPHIAPRFLSTEKYRNGHLRVLNALPYRRVLGLHSPDMKNIAKELSENGQEFIKRFEQQSSNELFYEETVIWGFLINLCKCSLEERFKMLEQYIPVIDNWGVCDSYCAHAKWMERADKQQLWNFIERWFDSANEFEVRFAIIVSMCRFLNEEWLDKVFLRIDKLDLERIKSNYKSVKGKPVAPQQGTVQGKEPYYVRMGIAWLLATALFKFPQQTREFVGKSHLPEDVIKLYVRKARESFRTKTIKAI